MYQIGDRVRCLVGKPENNGHIVCGSTGTVMRLSPLWGFEFDYKGGML